MLRAAQREQHSCSEWLDWAPLKKLTSIKATPLTILHEKIIENGMEMKQNARIYAG